MTVDIFTDAKIRDAWFDANGLSKAWEAPKEKNRPKRNVWFASIVFAMNTLAVATLVLPPVPAQAVVMWPTGPTAESVKESLRDSLRALKSLRQGWGGHEIAAPVRESLMAAERILPQLPNFFVSAKAGVDGDGNVYFRLSKGSKVAYLTVEPKLLHLLCTEPGKTNIYIDDQKFKGNTLPPRIIRVLTENLRT